MFGQRISFSAITKVFGVFLFLALSAAPCISQDWRSLETEGFIAYSEAAEAQSSNVVNYIENWIAVVSGELGTNNLRANPKAKVLIFKDKASLYHFLRGIEGATGETNAIFFQSGDDAYLFIAAGASETKGYQQVLCDYLRFLIDSYSDKKRVPAWLAEGAAQYYGNLYLAETAFASPQNLEGALLDTKAFWGQDYESARQRRESNAGAFERQSWLIFHYLIHGARGRYRQAFQSYVKNAFSGSEKLLPVAEALGAGPDTFDKEIRLYLRAGKFETALKNIKTAPHGFHLRAFTEIGNDSFLAIKSEFYLGRPEGALLAKNTLGSAAPGSKNARTLVASGMQALKNGLPDKALELIDEAIKAAPQDHLPHYWRAYVLSREGVTENGFVSGYSAKTSEEIFEGLERSISLAPEFPPALSLFAFVAAASANRLEQAELYAKRAVGLAPGRISYQFDLAAVYFAKHDFNAAKVLASEALRHACGDLVRLRGQNLLSRINSLEFQLAEIERMKNFPKKRQETPEKPLSEEEIAKLNEIAEIEGINDALRKPPIGESRILAKIGRVDCKGNRIRIFASDGRKEYIFSAKAFDAIKLVSFSAEAYGTSLSCGFDRPGLLAVFTFLAAAEGIESGSLSAIEFVPGKFKLKAP